MQARGKGRTHHRRGERDRPRRSLRFAEGVSVVAVDVDGDTVAETAALVSDAGGEVTTCTADVAPEDCAAMVEHAETTFDRLDVLFNNAGVMLAGDDDAVSTEESVWDRTMSINAKGVFLGCKHGIPALRRRGRGR